MTGRVNLLIAFVLTCLFAAVLITASGWRFGAALFPMLTAGVGLGLCLLFFAIATYRWRRDRDTPASHDAADPAQDKAARRQEAIAFAWTLSFFAAVGLVGFQWGLPATMLAYYRFEARTGWITAAVMAAGGWGFLYLMGSVLHLPLYEGLLFAR